MKFQLLAFLFLSPLLTSSFKEKNTTATSASKVFLCNSANGKKYHFSKNCKGLSNCKHEIIEVTLTEAKNRGKTLCGYED